MNSFEKFNLPALIQDGLTRLKITEPTAIQDVAIPVILEGHDLLASAQTGTGKTFAYLIPLIMKLLENPKQKALILTPTRELAIQVKDAVAQLLGTKSDLTRQPSSRFPQRTGGRFQRKPEFSPSAPVTEGSLTMALLIGGEPMPKQWDQLRLNPRIIVGTPGRINDHLARGKVSFDHTAFWVLDEMDRMLDLGFAEQIEIIQESIPESRQTLMFSATVPPHIERLSQKYLKNPKRLSTGSTTQPTSQVKQDIIHTSSADKLGHLMRELDEREGTVIVFVKTKIGAEELSERLRDENHEADALHGGLHQRQRERVIKSFRNQKSRIIVATDVAARGLDVPHVQHVIHYDLPQCPEDYIHRTGRTGRAGATGHALCLIGPDDKRQWRAINQLMSGQKVTRMPAPQSSGSSYGRDSFRPRSPRPSSGERNPFPSYDRPSSGGPSSGFGPKPATRTREGGPREGEQRSFDQRPVYGTPGKSNENGRRFERPSSSRPKENNDAPRRRRSFSRDEFAQPLLKY